MQPQIEIQFEIEPILPDRSSDIEVYFGTALKDAISTSSLHDALVGEPKVTFEQSLPFTKEQIEIAIITIGFLLKESPTIWKRMQTFLDFLSARLSKKAPTKVSIRAKIDDRIISASVSPGDTIIVSTEGGELTFRPRKQQK